ncbi:amidase signature enzyme, partial [Zopfia rhizophila CBS 207.26]
KVAVPSRCPAMLLNFKPRPLEGIRFAVKDNFDIKGTRTTLGSRAYFELYPPANESADCVKMFTGAGAVLLGKTKLCSFISKEDTTEAVDYPAPFNPRADGYQSSSGSSTGSASAVSSYDWIDFTLGTDTNGSGRRPANVHGCFGLRPSQGLIPVKGIIPSFERFDVPCIFSRDIRYISQIAHFLVEANNETFPEVRQENLPIAFDMILYPLDFLPTSNSVQMDAIDSLVADLESVLNIKKTEISIANTWQESAPNEADSDNLHEWLRDAGWAPVFYDNTHNLDEFRAHYAKTFNKKPYATPYNRWKWSLGQTITLEKRNAEIQKLDSYRDWLLQEVFKTSIRQAIMILPIDEPMPAYRDAQPAPSVLRNGDLPLNLSPIMGAPEVTIPLAEMSYESEISGRIEYLPITVSILGPPGLPC